MALEPLRGKALQAIPTDSTHPRQKRPCPPFRDRLFAPSSLSITLAPATASNAAHAHRNASRRQPRNRCESLAARRSAGRRLSASKGETQEAGRRGGVTAKFGRGAGVRLAGTPLPRRPPADPMAAPWRPRAGLGHAQTPASLPAALRACNRAALTWRMTRLSCCSIHNGRPGAATPRVSDQKPVKHRPENTGNPFAGVRFNDA